MGSLLLWGAFATLVLTILLSGSRILRITRMSVPLMLGTMLSPDWDRAERFGIGLHLLIGWMNAIVYGLLFEDLSRATWWLGALFGAVHGLALLVIGMNVLPHLHPRMSSEIEEPSDLPMLEPPGFLALNYGRGTPIVTILAHLIYGAILGGTYRP